MCTADAILFYGVCVMAADLIFAARAWPEIEPALRTIELIQARRRRGALQTTGAAGVAGVPDEIWEMILRELANNSVQEEEYAFVESFHCCGKSTCSCKPLVPRAGIEHFTVCDECVSSVSDNGGMTGQFRGDLKTIQACLLHFGLQLAGELLQSTEEGGAELDSLACLTCQPPPARGRLIHAVSTDMPHDVTEEAGHDVLRLSPDAFDVPSDAFSRFHRFLRLFDFRTYEPIRSKRNREKMPAKKHGDKDKATEGRPRALPRGSGTPGWHLCVRGEDCA